jgi:ubiquinone/menaquinone biosynthesis C-methylase UbiE
MNNHTVFPASRARHLEGRLRKFLLNPDRLAEIYANAGDQILDIGCGSGLITRSLARVVGDTGRVNAVDIQQGMLDILDQRAKEEGVITSIRHHLAEPCSLRLSEQDSFALALALAFYVVHETSVPAGLFQEVYGLVKPEGRFLMVEPKLSVNKAELREECDLVQAAGFSIESYPSMLLSRCVISEGLVIQG